MISKHGRDWHGEVHRPLSWACPFCPGTSAAFSDADEATAHFRDSHNLGLSDEELRTIAGQSRLQMRRSRGECLICCLPILSESSPGASADREKRQQEPGGPSSPKRARSDPGLASPGQKIQNAASRDGANLVARDNQGGKDDSLPMEVDTRHIASHMQGLAYLTIRLIPAHDHNNSDTTSQGSFGDMGLQSSNNSRRSADEGSRKADAWDDSSEAGDTDIYCEPVPDIDETELTAVWDHIPPSRDLPSRQDDRILRHLQRKQQALSRSKSRFSSASTGSNIITRSNANHPPPLSSHAPIRGPGDWAWGAPLPSITQRPPMRPSHHFRPYQSPPPLPTMPPFSPPRPRGPTLPDFSFTPPWARPSRSPSPPSPRLSISPPRRPGRPRPARAPPTREGSPSNHDLSPPSPPLPSTPIGRHPDN